MTDPDPEAVEIAARGPETDIDSDVQSDPALGEGDRSERSSAGAAVAANPDTHGEGE